MNNYYENEDLNKVASELTRIMPSLANFYSSQATLRDYSHQLHDYKAPAEHLQRQAHFKRLIKEKINRLFNEEELRNIKLDLPDDQCVGAGVIDHHGIVDNPILFCGPIVSDFYKIESRAQFGDILTFATGNVPLNEPFRRRGFMFHGRKINLYAKKDKNRIVYAMPIQDFDIVKRLEVSHEWHTYSKEEQDFLLKINDIIKKIDFSTCKYLGDQITKINFHLWPLLFEEKIRPNVTNLISLEYDDIVIDYLIHVIENDKESFIYRMLFDDKFRSYTVDTFSGAVGAWNDEKEVGTHFFWGVDSDGERIRYEADGNTLKSSNGSTIQLNEQEVITLLKDRKLLPGMLLKFALIIFYMGMKPFAGFSSIEYLTRMRQRVINFLKPEYPQEVSLVEALPINSMISIILTLQKKEDGVTSAPAFDVMFDGGLAKDYLDRLGSTTINAFMAPLLAYYGFGASVYGTEEDKKKTFDLPESSLYQPLERLFN